MTAPAVIVLLMLSITALATSLMALRSAASCSTIVENGFSNTIRE